MAEKKKKQRAEFAEDKKRFCRQEFRKGRYCRKRAKQKQSGAHQPRDADTTSGHDVQKSGQAKPSEHDADYFAKQNGYKCQKAGRTVMMCGIVTAVFRVMHRKRQGRKQNPVRKSADSKSSSREKTALWERKRNLTVAMLTVRQKAVFQRAECLYRAERFYRGGWRRAGRRYKGI